MEKFTGKVWVLGDDIDTDIIIPTEYLALKTIDDMKQYGFSPLRPELAGQIQKGDIIVAGKALAAVLQRAGTGDYQSTGNSVCHCKIICKNFLQKLHQQRTFADRAAGSSR